MNPMSRNATIILLILVMTATALGTGLLMVLSSNARISLENNELREERNEFKDRLLALQNQMSEMNAHLKDSQLEIRKLSDEAQRARQQSESQALANNSKAATNAPASFAPPQPVQVKTYVGNEYIGLSWIQPGNIRTHPETGQLIYEPVVRLSDSLRHAFTVTKTNIVERPVNQHATINYHYQQPYSYWWVPVHKNLPSTGQPIGGGGDTAAPPVTFPSGGGPWTVPSGGGTTQPQRNSVWKGDGTPWLPELIKPD